jgi:cell division septum initiation protein DivIVA
MGRPSYSTGNIKKDINNLEDSIDAKLTNIFTTLLSNKHRIKDFKEKLARAIGGKKESSKSMKLRQTAGKKKGKNKTQKSQPQSIHSSEIISYDDRSTTLNKILINIIKIHFRFIRLVPKGVQGLLTLILETLKIIYKIWNIPFIGKPLVLIIFYVLYSNPYTRIMLYVFMDITIAIWEMSPDVGVETYVREQVNKLKTILYGAFAYLVEYYGSQLVSSIMSRLTPQMAEYVAKVLFKDYLDGHINDITSELVRLRVQNSELATSLNQIQTDVFTNVQRIANIESGVDSSQNSLVRLENTIHSISGQNNEALQLIQSQLTSVQGEITSVGRLVMYSGDNFQTNAQLARLEGLLLTNLRTTDAGRFLNNFLPSNSLVINGLPTSSVFTAAAALGAAAYKSRYRPGSRLTNGPHSSF